MKQVTLLYSTADESYARELERHLLQATKQGVYVRHNSNAAPGQETAAAWETSLHAHVFVVLVSADLSVSKKMQYVEQALRSAHNRIIPVYLRPCSLDDNGFEGVPVIPSRPITSYSGAAKEQAWVSIVRRIVSMLAEVDEVPAMPIHPTPVQKKEHPWQRPVTQERVLPPTPPIEKRVERPVAPPVQEQERTPQEWGVTLLYASADRAWVPFVERTLSITSMTTLKNIHFTIVTPDAQEADERVFYSKLTIALISPDFLASPWMAKYDHFTTLLAPRRTIFPLLIRNCEWKKSVHIPRARAIGKTSNDATWSEVSREILRTLRGWYPDVIPPERIGW